MRCYAAVPVEPILTDRLILREEVPGDLDFLASMLADTEVMRYWPSTLSREESAAWIERQRGRYARDGCSYWLALRRDTSEPVGQAGVVMLEWAGEGPRPALGYMIHRPFWRRGYATEAARASCEFIWNVLRQPIVWTLIRPENEPSLGVARKLGMIAGERVQHYGFEHIVFTLVRG